MFIVKNFIRVLLAGAAMTGAAWFATPAQAAYGDAPWCAAIEIGAGEVYWDCQYETFEACQPTILAGNRGLCSPNPAPGAPRAASAGNPRHGKRRTHRH
jgi:Protein of unknown function (DUF3551)